MRYMNNKKMMYCIEKVIDSSLVYWDELNDKYCDSNGYNKIPLTIYTTRFVNPYPDNIVSSIRNAVDARMITLLTACGKIDETTPVDDQIVKSVGGGVYMSYENFYALVIDCQLNFNNVFECMKFTLRHEMGHIIDKNIQCLGKTVREWNKINDIEVANLKKIPKMRKNASYENRLKWYKEYLQIPQEKRANEHVGITEDDIIADWKRTH